MQPHHRFLLRRILAHIDFLEQSLAQVEREIEAHLHPFEEAMALVQSITGIQETTAAGILAEIGVEMTRFPSDKHLASWAISRTKDNYLSAYYHRIARRRGKKKAIVALEHKVLVIIYHVLRTKKPYADLGADYFDQRDRTRVERHHIHRLEQPGYTVTLTPKEAA